MIKHIRKFIIKALDDENGINAEAYDEAKTICQHYGWNDILQLTEVTGKNTQVRYYLGEDDASDLVELDAITSQVECEPTLKLV